MVPLDPAVTEPGLDLESSPDCNTWAPAATSGDGSIVNTLSSLSWALEAEIAAHPTMYFRLVDNGDDASNPPGYEAFQLAHWGSTTAPEAARAGDPDGDQLPNGIEYYLGLDPNLFSPLPEPVEFAVPGPDWVRYQFPLDPQVTDSGLDFEYSLDSVNWQDAATLPDGSIVSSRFPAFWKLEVQTEIHPVV